MTQGVSVAGMDLQEAMNKMIVKERRLETILKRDLCFLMLFC
jgi:hypothetical protein